MPDVEYMPQKKEPKDTPNTLATYLVLSMFFATDAATHYYDDALQWVELIVSFVAARYFIKGILRHLIEKE